MDVAALAELLHETSQQHGSFEAIAPPHDWWDWYAAYMDARQRGNSPEEASFCEKETSNGPLVRSNGVLEASNGLSERGHTAVFPTTVFPPM